MDKYFESWSNGNGELMLYTENAEVARMVKAMFKDVTTYERNGRVFAWQYLVPKNKLSFVETQISENLDVETKELTTPP